MALLRDRPPFNSTGPEWPPQPSPSGSFESRKETPQRRHVHASQLSRRGSNTFSKLTHSSLVFQSPFFVQNRLPPILPPLPDPHLFSMHRHRVALVARRGHVPTPRSLTWKMSGH
jgi:hypothetical protein